MKWINIWENEPTRYEEILFATGDEATHYGEIFSDEKLIKASFHCFHCRDVYNCDSKTTYEERVIYWSPIPKYPHETH